MATCPMCLQDGATKFLWLVRCPNPTCPKFDPRMQAVGFRKTMPTAPMTSMPETTRPAPEPRPDAAPPAKPPTSRGGWRRAAGIVVILAGIGIMFGAGSSGIKFGLLCLYFGWQLLSGSKR